MKFNFQQKYHSERSLRSKITKNEKFNFHSKLKLKVEISKSDFIIFRKKTIDLKMIISVFVSLILKIPKKYTHFNPIFNKYNYNNLI